MICIMEQKVTDGSLSIVSNCERMHAHLPTTKHWLTDLATRTPSTYGVLNVLTPFDSTLALSKKRAKELKRNKSRALPVLASFIFFPDGMPCSEVLKTSNKTEMPRNRGEMISDAKMTGKRK